MKKVNSKFIGWQVSSEEFAVMSEIQENYRYRTISQVLYNLMYSEFDINGLLEESKNFAIKQKNNLKKV